MKHKAEALAWDILILSRNTLLVNLRFLDAALSMFTPVPSELPLATDGRKLYYNCRHVLLQYKEEKKASVRDYLHLVMHCVFRHMYIHTLVDQPLWDLSCDIAVEEVINSLGLDCTTSRRQSQQSAELDRLRKQLKLITAEKVYHWYRKHPPADLKALRELFWGDDHTPWYPQFQPQAADDVSGNGEEQPSPEVAANTASGNGEEQSSPEDVANAASGNGEEQAFLEGAASGSSSIEQTWEKIAQRMQMDLETFSKQVGDQAGTLTQNLRDVNREKYDYTAFLKRFAVRGEVMSLDPEEFDYIYYTYGLTLYGKMPLIEPLEYREVKRIREFAIAIDTSASTSGELVQRFIQKTYNILKSTESFFAESIFISSSAILRYRRIRRLAARRNLMST